MRTANQAFKSAANSDRPIRDMLKLEVENIEIVTCKREHIKGRIFKAFANKYDLMRKEMRKLNCNRFQKRGVLIFDCITVSFYFPMLLIESNRACKEYMNN